MSIRHRGEVQKDTVFIFRNAIRYPVWWGWGRRNNTLLIQQEEPRCGDFVRREYKRGAKWLPHPHFPALQSLVFNQTFFENTLRDRITASFNFPPRARAWCARWLASRGGLQCVMLFNPGGLRRYCLTVCSPPLSRGDAVCLTGGSWLRRRHLWLTSGFAHRPCCESTVLTAGSDQSSVA